MLRINNWPQIKSPWARIDPSPWPLSLSVFLFSIPIGFVIWVWSGTFVVVILSIFCLIIPIRGWVGDIIQEGSFSGVHTTGVLITLTRATILFIFSEVIFFFTFFWAWAHNAWAPTVFVGLFYPAFGVSPVHPLGLPFFNLASLVWRSGTVNLANGYIRLGQRINGLLALGVTILLGVAFEIAQLREYQRAAFRINDGVFGSSFFLLTGFHGAHVIGGIGFLFFNWIRLYYFHFHTGFNIGWIARVWYWHFVDVIWVFLWCVVYGWGGAGHFVYF